MMQLLGGGGWRMLEPSGGVSCWEGSRGLVSRGSNRIHATDMTSFLSPLTIHEFLNHSWVHPLLDHGAGCARCQIGEIPQAES